MSEKSDLILCVCVCLVLIQNISEPYGGFQKMVVPQMDILEWKILLNWMI